MNSKYFNGDGSLSDKGRNLLVHFKGSLEKLFGTLEAQDLTTVELYMLSSTMMSMVANKIANRLAFKRQRAIAFDGMTNEQFEAYLLDKYGSVWKYLDLTEEEDIRAGSLSKGDR